MSFSFVSLITTFQSFGLFFQILWCVLIGELIRRLFTSIYYNKIKHQPPGPAGLPIIGSLISFAWYPASFLLDSAKQYGPIMSINLGLQRNIFVNDKSLYKKICMANKNIVIQKPHFNYIDIVLKEPSIDLVNGKQWLLRRKLLSSSFLTLVNSKFVSSTIDYSLSNIYDELDSKKVWYPRHDIKYIVFNVAFKALFGSALDNKHKIFSTFFKLNTQLLNGFSIFVLLDIFKINFLPNCIVSACCVNKVNKTTNKIFEMIETWMIEEGGFQIDKNKEIIKRINPDKSDQKYYIDTVIEYLENNDVNDPDSSISYYALMLDLNVILMAAADTTAHSTEYGLCLLCKHQDIQQIIYDEIKRVLNKHSMNKFDINIINECVNLRAFVYETLRISTVVPLNPHFNNKNINIEHNNKTYFVPKNSTIMINTAYIHYKSYNNSFDINLNNWIDSNTNKFKLNPNFILFGTGKRNCVGQSLAMRELYYIIGTLLLKYKLQVNDKEEKIKLNKMKQAWNFITTLDPEIGINLTKR